MPLKRLLMILLVVLIAAGLTVALLVQDGVAGTALIPALLAAAVLVRFMRE